MIQKNLNTANQLLEQTNDAEADKLQTEFVSAGMRRTESDD